MRYAIIVIAVIHFVLMLYLAIKVNNSINEYVKQQEQTGTRSEFIRVRKK